MSASPGSQCCLESAQRWHRPKHHASESVPLWVLDPFQQPLHGVRFLGSRSHHLFHCRCRRWPAAIPCRLSLLVRPAPALPPRQQKEARFQDRPRWQPKKTWMGTRPAYQRITCLNARICFLCTGENWVRRCCGSRTLRVKEVLAGFV